MWSKNVSYSPEQGLLENLIDSCYIKNYYLANKLNAETYELFMEMSYDKPNVGSVITFEDTSYTLIREGRGIWGVVQNHKVVAVGVLVDGTAGTGASDFLVYNI